MARWHWLVPILLAGCDGRTPVDTDTGDDTDDGDPIDVESMLDDLEGYEECEGYDGYDIPGATSYWVGDLSVHGEDVEGWEHWVLVANDAWQETGDVGERCVISWEVFGQVVETGACGTCDYGIQIDAYVDEPASTCPPDLWRGEEHYAVTYDIRVGGGAVHFYYAESGNELAEGEASGSQLTYVTEPTCKFF